MFYRGKGEKELWLDPCFWLSRGARREGQFERYGAFFKKATMNIYLVLDL